MRTKYTFYNAISSLLYYLATILLGILNRKAIIALLGIEYQGINGLFGNILSMLSIAELGIGTAIVYHLYKPIKEQDILSIRLLMNFYRKCYLLIAVIISILGTIIVPFLGYIVSDYSLPYKLSVLYMWFLLDAVCSYVFSYRRSILMVDQKNFIVIGCDLLYQFLVKLGQIAILYLTHDFILYLLIMVICRILDNFLIYGISNRMYPFLKEHTSGTISAEILSDIKRKVKGAFFHKIGSFIVLGTDNILISRFLGLAVVGIYSNYYLIINSISSICTQILTAATASVGHLLRDGDSDKSYTVFMELQILNIGLINCAAAGIYNVATPLISLIFGEKYIVGEGTLLILTLNFCVQGMRTVYGVFKETSGILYEDRFIPLIESAINLISSVILLQYWGLSGVFMGTILSSLLLYNYTYPILVYRTVLKRTIRDYYKECAWFGMTFLGNIALTKFVCTHVSWGNPMLQILSNTLLTVVISIVIFFVFYAKWKKETSILLQHMKIIFRNR